MQCQIEKERGTGKGALCGAHYFLTGNWRSGNGIFLSGSASDSLQYVQEITLHLCFHFLWLSNEHNDNYLL